MGKLIDWSELFSTTECLKDFITLPIPIISLMIVVLSTFLVIFSFVVCLKDKDWIFFLGCLAIAIFMMMGVILIPC